MKVAVIPNLTRVRAKAVTETVCARLTSLGAEFAFDESQKNELSHIRRAAFLKENELYGQCDAVISIGGDGSVMRAAKTASKYKKKILGINAGKLAYLCGLDADETELLSNLLTGEYAVCRRMMLSAELIRDGESISRENCLNDIVFGRGKAIALSDVTVTANGRVTAEYVADGVIVSTPTGSTAYSMSAGGPILEPSLDAVLLTPICPHSLVSRPYIFSSDTVFEVTCTPIRPGDSTGFSCDGGETKELLTGDRVRISKSESYVDIISIKPDNFVNILNGKTELKK